MNKFLFTVFIFFIFLASSQNSNASTSWITKKSNSQEKVKEIENMYRDGFLSKNECVKAKEKILKTSNFSKTNCDSIKVKKNYITKKKSDKSNYSVTLKNTNKVFYSNTSVKDALLKCYSYVGDLRKKNVDKSFMDCEAGEPSSKTLTVDKDNKYNWYALVKHPETDYEFIATKVSNIKDARRIALEKCYKFEKEQLGINSETKCYVDIVVDANISLQLANKILNKQEKQITSDTLAVANKKKFAPKNMLVDNDPPVITVQNEYTFNDSFFKIDGQVSDKSNETYIDFNGNIMPTDNGKFTIKGFSPVDKEIKITAIDEWGNKSKSKLIKVYIKLDETEIAEVIEPLNPTNIKIRPTNNKVALIIGVEEYSDTSKASYANLDAKYFYDYAIKAFGAKKQNIKLLINEEANRVSTIKALKKWLKSKVRFNQTDLIVFFAGHGMASSDGKELYLLPQDGDPDLLADTALSRTSLFETIIDLKPKSVTMFLDTCYSGMSRDEEMLLASARPIRIVVEDQDGVPDNFTIFSASQMMQISSGFKDVEHGIFSYYLMKGLEGKADTNKDKKITNGELLAYMDQNVSQKASEYGRQQNPTLSGNPDKVLINYR